MKFKVFYYSTYSRFNWIHLVQQICKASRPFKRTILLCFANQASQLLSPLNWKKIFQTFSVMEKRNRRMQRDLVNKEGVPVTLSLNHELFARQHASCVQGYLPKQIWASFSVFSRWFFLVECSVTLHSTS